MKNYEVDMRSGRAYFVTAASEAEARSEAVRLALVIRGLVEEAIDSREMIDEQ